MSDPVLTLDLESIPLAPTGKRARTKVANRAAILDAARQVFGELGYEAATVRDIIRRTGLSVGAFYNYYRSKEEVYEALADDGARRFRPILHAQYEQAEDFESYLRGAIRAYFEFLITDSQAWLAQRPRGERHPQLRLDTPEMLAVFNEVRASIAEAIDKGLAPPVDAEYLAGACIGVAREVGDLMLERRPPNLDEAADFAVRMLLGGIAAAPRRPAPPPL
jgi:AcrR family transcriptional regulator